MRDIDFSALTPADALDLAVLIEEEARQRYLEFIDMMHEVHHNTEAAKFFAFMAENEQHHRDELAERRQRLYPNEPSRVTGTMIYDVEAPEYDEPQAFMSIRECLDLAMAAEVKAENFFRRTLDTATTPEVRALFAELAEEEVEHQKMVAEQLAKLPADESPLTPEDVADEPVSQG